jgi:putative FmdB family regulatory protein
LPETIEPTIIIYDIVLTEPRRRVMPTYEYVCVKCGEQFVRIMSLKEFEAGQVTCPKCNTTEVKQQMSQFIPKTSRKS